MIKKFEGVICMPDRYPYVYPLLFEGLEVDRKKWMAPIVIRLEKICYPGKRSNIKLEASIFSDNIFLYNVDSESLILKPYMHLRDYKDREIGVLIDDKNLNKIITESYNKSKLISLGLCTCVYTIHDCVHPYEMEYRYDKNCPKHKNEAELKMSI